LESVKSNISTIFNSNFS